MKLGVSQSPVLSDDTVNVHPSGAVSFSTVAASWRPSCASCLLVKRVSCRWSPLLTLRRPVGVSSLTFALRGRLATGRGRVRANSVRDACFVFHVQWTSSCDPSATSSAVLYRISDRRRGGASASVHRQSGQCARWRASCVCTETGRCPQFLAFWSGFRGVAVH